MAEGGISTGDDTGSQVERSAPKCCSCEGPLASTKSMLMCKSCCTDGSRSYLCHHCVVLHVRKSHSVTDQNGEDVEVCGQHKNVCMFMCKTCNLKWFCNDCFNVHAKHEYMEISESNGEMKKILGRIHNVLSRSDLNYKQGVKFSEKAKQNEQIMKDINSRYSESYIEDCLNEVWENVVQNVGPSVKQVVSNNRKSVSSMSTPVKETAKALQSVGDAQVQLRQMLSSSLTQIAKVHSNGGIDRVEREQTQPLRISMLTIDDMDLRTFDQSLANELKPLENNLTTICSEFVNKFRFDKVKEEKMDLRKHRGFDSRSEATAWKKLETPLKCERTDIAANEDCFALSCIDDHEFTIFRYSDLNKNPTKMLRKTNSIFSEIFGSPNIFAVCHQTLDSDHWMNDRYGRNNTRKFRLVTIIANNRNEIGTVKMCEEKVGVIWDSRLCLRPNFFNASNSIIQPSKLESRQLGVQNYVSLVHSGAKSDHVHGIPYGFTFVAMSLTPMLQLNAGMIVTFIKDRSTQIVADFGAGFRFFKIDVPCEDGPRHLGRFGCCCVLQKVNNQSRILRVGNWCLDCKVLEVHEATILHGRNTTFTSLSTFNLPDLHLEKVVIFKRSCVVLTNNQQVLICEDVFAYEK